MTEPTILVAIIGALSNIVSALIGVFTVQLTLKKGDSSSDTDKSRRWPPFVFAAFVGIGTFVAGIAIAWLLLPKDDRFSPRVYPVPHSQEHRTDDSLNIEIPANEIVCLIGGEIAIPDLGVSLNADNHGSVACWIGKQRAVATSIKDDQSFARIGYQDFDAIEVANFWAQYWARRRIVGPDGCGEDLCEAVDIVLIRSDQTFEQLTVTR